MKVQLSKRGLLFHHHHGSFPFFHHVKLSLLIPNLLLVLKLELVVPLEFFFSVTALQIQFDFNVANMGHNPFLHTLLGFFGLISLQLCHAFATFLRLEGFFLLLLGCLLRLLRRDDHGLGQGHLER